MLFNILRIILISFVLMNVYKEAGPYTVGLLLVMFIELQLSHTWREGARALLGNLVEQNKKLSDAFLNLKGLETLVESSGEILKQLREFTNHGKN